MSDNIHTLEEPFRDGTMKFTFDYDTNCATLEVNYDNGVEMKYTIKNDSMSFDPFLNDKHGNRISERGRGAPWPSRDHLDTLSYRAKFVASMITEIGLDFAKRPGVRPDEESEPGAGFQP